MGGAGTGVDVLCGGGTAVVEMRAVAAGGVTSNGCGDLRAVLAACTYVMAGEVGGADLELVLDWLVMTMVCRF